MENCFSMKLEFAFFVNFVFLVSSGLFAFFFFPLLRPTNYHCSLSRRFGQLYRGKNNSTARLFPFDSNEKKNSSFMLYYKAIWFLGL